jgi:5-dehydro-2-deoxygluconokinase
MNVESNSDIKIKNSSITSPEIQGDLQKSIQQILNLGVKLLLVKTGPKGVDAYFSDGSKEIIPGFPVKVVNVLGAGDAFAAGFVYGYTKGWDTYKSARFANACGAWLVTKQGCCTDSPNNKQIMDFINNKGGF